MRSRNFFEKSFSSSSKNFPKDRLSTDGFGYKTVAVFVLSLCYRVDSICKSLVKKYFLDSINFLKVFGSPKPFFQKGFWKNQNERLTYESD